jgi:hypothetical protein
MTNQNPRPGALIGLDPTSGPLPVRPERVERPRPASLDGAVIGLVANGLGESKAFFTALYEELEGLARLGGGLAVLKPSVSVPPDPMDWEKLISQVTVAVAGFGG